MKSPRPKTLRERRWVFFDNGCVHGVQHSQLVVIRSIPRRSIVQDTVAVFSLSKAFSWTLGLTVLIGVLLFLTSCALPRAQRGGGATSTIVRPGHTNTVTLAQSDNPKEPSRQTVQSEQTVEYVLPAGSEVVLGEKDSESPTRESKITSKTRTDPRLPPPGSRPLLGALREPMPVRCTFKDRTDTTIGGAQKDIAREWAGKAANLQPVMWAGILMMTAVAGVLVYFGWWTKAALALAIGAAMVIVAQTLPDDGTLILLSGLGVFGLAALLVLYAYHKGQLDKNNDGIPDFLQRKPGTTHG